MKKVILCLTLFCTLLVPTSTVKAARGTDNDPSVLEVACLPIGGIVSFWSGIGTIASYLFFRKYRNNMKEFVSHVKKLMALEKKEAENIPLTTNELLKKDDLLFELEEILASDNTISKKRLSKVRKALMKKYNIAKGVTIGFGLGTAAGIGMMIYGGYSINRAFNQPKVIEREEFDFSEINERMDEAIEELNNI